MFKLGYKEHFIPNIKMKLEWLLLICLFSIAYTRFVNRIIGGSDARPNAYPNIVAAYGFIKRDNHTKSMLCSGVIYNELWITVTAYCATEIRDSKKHFTVIAGKWRISRPELTTQVQTVALVRIHEGYDPKELQLGRSINLGLIKLDKALKFNENITAIPFSRKREYPSGTAILLGWGSTTKEDSLTEVLGDILQVLDVDLIPKNDCIDVLMVTTSISSEIKTLSSFSRKSHFCTGNFVPQYRGATFGDSGGPVMQLNETGQYNVIGIISVGFAEVDLGMHINIPYFIPWIEAEIAAFSDP